MTLVRNNSYQRTPTDSLKRDAFPKANPWKKRLSILWIQANEYVQWRRSRSLQHLRYRIRLACPGIGPRPNATCQVTDRLGFWEPTFWRRRSLRRRLAFALAASHTADCNDQRNKTLHLDSRPTMGSVPGNGSVRKSRPEWNRGTELVCRGKVIYPK